MALWKSHVLVRYHPWPCVTPSSPIEASTPQINSYLHALNNYSHNPQPLMWHERDPGCRPAKGTPWAVFLASLSNLCKGYLFILTRFLCCLSSSVYLHPNQTFADISPLPLSMSLGNTVQPSPPPSSLCDAELLCFCNIYGPCPPAHMAVFRFVTRWPLWYQAPDGVLHN